MLYPIIQDKDTSIQILTFDIGATKTNVGLFAGQTGFPVVLNPPRFFQTYQNTAFDRPEDLVAAVLKRIGTSVDIAVLAAAGPVVKQRARLINLSWVIDRAELQDRFKRTNFFVINDLEAVSLGIPHLQVNDTQTLIDQPHVPQATIAVISSGTGLGESFLTWSGDRFVAHPSEGGHSDFAPIDALQMSLLEFLMQTWDHVSYERVCAGPGLYHIYRFLKECQGIPEPIGLAEKFAVDQDPPRTIIAAASDPAQICTICRTTLDLFATILGAAAGNLALRTLSRGGVYIAGGIPPRIMPYLTTNSFRNAFLNKGRMKVLVETIPVKVILNPRIPLYGAAAHGLQCVSD